MTLDSGPNAVTTNYDYETLGNLISQTDARRNVTRFEYDALGRRTKRTLPGGQIEGFACNPRVGAHEKGPTSAHLN